jgi:hypothetical protein
MNIEKYIEDNKLNIIVKANSPKNQIKEYDESRKALKVDIKAAAENNKANIEIIKFFSKLTGRRVKIAAGLTSKKKLLRFE